MVAQQKRKQSPNVLPAKYLYRQTRRKKGSQLSMYVVSIYLPILYFVDSAIELKHLMSEEQKQKNA